MKKVMKFLGHRVFLVGLALALQLGALWLMLLVFENYFVYFYSGLTLLSMIVVIIIISGNSNPGYKIAWIIPVLLFPIFGGALYLMFGGNKISKHEKKKMQRVKLYVQNHITQDEILEEKLKAENMDAYLQSHYLKMNADCPVYQNSSTEYLSTGEACYETLLEELRKAEKFIFLEFFIVHEGIMWNSILEVLEQKVKQGVDVRFLYDDMGSIFTLPNKYYRQLERKGIKCSAFNPFIPILTKRLNNRDHRKIVVIDGKVAFTGGINLADEYINVVEKYGHWKDNGILVRGEAVWSFTVLFLSLWDYVRKTEENYLEFLPQDKAPKIKTDGYIQPYGDSPLDEEATGETVYMNLINRAKKYIYITTPYLILDNEMTTALCNAAKSGIDVRIITPGIPDKKLVNQVTKANYAILLQNGVRIFEYKKGFIHAKTFVVDDAYATVGTVNMDYRSLYLHFECGVWLYQSSCIANIKKDLVETISQSREIKLEETENISGLTRMMRAILKVFAPLM